MQSSLYSDLCSGFPCGFSLRGHRTLQLNGKADVLHLHPLHLRKKGRIRYLVVRIIDISCYLDAPRVSSGVQVGKDVVGNVLAVR